MSRLPARHARGDHVLAWLLGVGLCLPALAQEAALGASLESLLAYARTHSQELTAMRAEAQAAQERVEPAAALPDPRLRVTLQDITRAGTQNPTLAPARTGATAYQWMQDLPGWGKRALRRDVAQSDAQSMQAKARLGETELAARIKVTFAQGYLVRASHALTLENQDLMQRLEKVALARYSAGLAPQQDVIRAQVEQGSLAAEAVEQDMERHHLDARLNALLSRPTGAPLASPERLRPMPDPARLDLPTLTQRLLERNATLASEQARLQGARLARELTRKNRWPDFTLGVTPMQMGSAIRQWELMLEVNLPLQRGTRDAQEREAEALVDAAQARHRAALDQASSDLAQAVAALLAAQRVQTLTTQRLVPQAELTFQSALAGYENGKVDFATLLEAQRQIRTARLGLLKALVDAQMQLADIERLVGEEL